MCWLLPFKLQTYNFNYSYSESKEANIKRKNWGEYLIPVIFSAGSTKGVLLAMFFISKIIANHPLIIYFGDFFSTSLKSLKVNKLL